MLGWWINLEAKEATPAFLWEQDLHDGHGTGGRFTMYLALDYWVFPS